MSMEAWDRWHILADEQPDPGNRVLIEYFGREGRVPRQTLGMRFTKEITWGGGTTVEYWPVHDITRWRHLEQEAAERWQSAPHRRIPF